MNDLVELCFAVLILDHKVIVIDVQPLRPDLHREEFLVLGKVADE